MKTASSTDGLRTADSGALLPQPITGCLPVIKQIVIYEPYFPMSAPLQYNRAPTESLNSFGIYSVVVIFRSH
ncbi:expressed protein [Echinococcus multilocularis]|uniref:Expressed protein n=1 Tax=Echinococcus multilocularis TaxID=6211 RepID=A0A068YIW2_ECHMU|nr:expressed protein [Echinococcus multilocularis]